MPHPEPATYRTSLSLYPIDRAKLLELAAFLVDHGFAYSLALAFRTALASAERSPGPAPDPAVGTIATPLTVLLATRRGARPSEREQILAIAKRLAQPGDPIAMPDAVRRLIHAARKDQAFLAAAQELRALDRRRSRR